jgi:hypothetical protein
MPATKTFKTKVLQALQPHDSNDRVDFCNWIHRSFHEKYVKRTLCFILLHPRLNLVMNICEEEEVVMSMLHHIQLLH